MIDILNKVQYNFKLYFRVSCKMVNTIRFNQSSILTRAKRPTNLNNAAKNQKNIRFFRGGTFLGGIYRGGTFRGEFSGREFA